MVEEELVDQEKYASLNYFCLAREMWENILLS